MSSLSHHPLHYSHHKTLPPAKRLGQDVHKPPESAKDSRLAMFLWRLQLWFECTFGLTVMEPWERMVVLTLFAIISLLVLTGLVRYFPAKLVGLQRRTVYYLWGHADDFQVHLPALREQMT